MNNEQLRSKAPKMIGLVLAIAAVTGIIGYFAKERSSDDDAPTTTALNNATNSGATTPSNTGSSSKPEATTRTKPSSSTTSTPSASGSSSGTSTTNSSGYKDGTYSATGTYMSPEGRDSVSVTLTLKSGVITDSTFKGNATNPANQSWQSAFASGYQSLVVGKSISSLSLTVVNGSSLTPKGFMDAVNQIKTQAAS